jgi:hypothetical protein
MKIPISSIYPEIPGFNASERINLDCVPLKNRENSGVCEFEPGQFTNMYLRRSETAGGSCFESGGRGKDV